MGAVSGGVNPCWIKTEVLKEDAQEQQKEQVNKPKMLCYTLIAVKGTRRKGMEGR